MDTVINEPTEDGKYEYFEKGIYKCETMVFLGHPNFVVLINIETVIIHARSNHLKLVKVIQVLEIESYKGVKLIELTEKQTESIYIVGGTFNLLNWAVNALYCRT